MQLYNCKDVESNNPEWCNDEPVPNNPQTCAEWHVNHPGQTGTWKVQPPWDDAWTVESDTPDCEAAPWSRINHLGNGVNGKMNTYTWRIPDDYPEIFDKKCVVRIRYNTSSYDLDWDADAGANGKITGNPCTFHVLL